MIDPQAKSVGGITGVRNLSPWLGLKSRLQSRIGKRSNPLTLNQVKEKLYPNGGVYRHPDGYLVLMWDECESMVVLKPANKSGEPSSVTASLVMGNVFFSVIEPMTWPQAKRALWKEGIPDHIYQILVTLAVKHAYVTE
jgi:hypothetical protein